MSSEIEQLFFFLPINYFGIITQLSLVKTFLNILDVNLYRRDKIIPCQPEYTSHNLYFLKDWQLLPQAYGSLRTIDSWAGCLFLTNSRTDYETETFEILGKE